MNNNILIPLIILNNNNAFKIENNISSLNNKEELFTHNKITENIIPSPINQAELHKLYDELNKLNAKNKNTQKEINKAMNVLSKPLFPTKTLKNTLSNNNKSKLIPLLRKRKLYENRLKELNIYLNILKPKKTIKSIELQNNIQLQKTNIQSKLNNLNNEINKENKKIKKKYKL